MATTLTTSPAPIHPWTLAGLGAAPFRFLGVEHKVGPIRSVDPVSGVETLIGSPGQPMGACQYCGTGIAYLCHVQSADGRRSVVGTDCVEKIDQTLAPQATSARKVIERDARRAKAAALRAERDAARAAARLAEDARRAQAKAEARAAWDDANETVVRTLRATDSDFARSLLAQLDERGFLTEGQVAAVNRIAADSARRAAEVAGVAPEGRLTVRAVIERIHVGETAFGLRVSALLRVTDADGRTWRAWGGCPSGGPRPKAQWERGDEVVATATFARDARPAAKPEVGKFLRAKFLPV
jgi:hypothetical protein